MAKNKEQAVELPEEVLEVPVPEVVIPVISVQAPKKTYTLEQWASFRKTPARHLSGMRAFLGSEAGFKYTLSVWDDKMKAY